MPLCIEIDMATTLIVGYGNSLRADDGIGWVAAEQLAKIFTDPEVRVLARHQLTFELAAEAANVERLVLIDATQAGIPGRVAVEKIMPSEKTPSAFTHDLKPNELVACARQLYGSAPETWLVSVTGERFAYGDELSPSAAAALPEAIAEVLEIVNK
jgi:hydrogenase maturation protease